MMVSEGAGKGQVSVKEEAEKDSGAPGRWKVDTWPFPGY